MKEYKEMNIRNLNENELISFNGGSVETYNSGKEAGKVVREALDNLGIITIIVFIVTRGKVKIS